MTAEEKKMIEEFLLTLFSGVVIGLMVFIKINNALINQFHAVKFNGLFLAVKKTAAEVGTEQFIDTLTTIVRYFARLVLKCSTVEDAKIEIVHRCKTLGTFRQECADHILSPEGTSHVDEFLHQCTVQNL